MKILKQFQEINYTLKYAILPSNSIENIMRPSEELIKEQNNGEQFFIKLEKSVLESGIVNPIGIAAKKDKVYVTYGGSRLMIAQKHNLDVPCIIADFDNVFPEAEIIKEEEIPSYYKNPPTHFQLRAAKLYIHGCEHIHLKEKDTMVNVVCVKWGTKYGPEYVNILQAMVKRHLSLPHRFICFTDDKTGLNPDVETFPLTETYLEGWWHKLTLFKSDLFGLSGRTLYMDLDVVIIDSIDCFFNDYDDRFVIIKDWNSNDRFTFWNSSVFLYDIGKLSFVWDNFSKEEAKRIGGGDQIWISRQIPDAKTWPKTWCRSFKYECIERAPYHDPTEKRNKDKIPEGCKIVIFHGQPNPPEALTGKVLRYPAAPWIADHWRE